MKHILLTAGGTGGHIFPLLAVSDKLIKFGNNQIKLDFIGPKNRFLNEFQKREIKIHSITSAKLRRYFSLRNLIDVPKFIWSIIEAIIKVYFIMPDVVFSKGGPGSFPVILAAKFYFIPVIIHESDSIPSMNTKMASRFADRIGVSFRKTIDFFKKEKVFLSGNPIREELLQYWMEKDRAKSYLSFNSDLPLILVLGGSQGAKRINDFIIFNLDKIIPEFQIYHQLGEANKKETKEEIDYSLRSIESKNHIMYKYVGFFNSKELKYAMNAADIVISRGGAGAISEISAFGKPSIIIPLKESAGGHQTINAYEYASNGGAVVIEENNLGINILLDQIRKIVNSPKEMQEMGEAAKSFSRPKADEAIVQEIFNYLI
jgi:UDP-N-acetylglucosamine--N-acetylmuramyl-(pentapeptide) pyrophosphoryl-undecaprenol N-acetylglucosamine transferase